MTKKKEMKFLKELISLRGKRAMVTGAAAGIGRAIAYRLAEAGASLELVDINQKEMEMVKKELSRFGVDINIHRVDLSRKEEIVNLWENVGDNVDILINNAGIYLFKDFLEVNDEFLQKNLEVNLKSVFWMCQEMIRRRGKRGGVILNVASIEAVLPF
ncbi:MAG: SDR family oxidoreductase, partial [Thermoplasmata archaeon]|nr:SDR family oxidoreductase [Thermoplasmata archaeon]